MRLILELTRDISIVAFTKFLIKLPFEQFLIIMFDFNTAVGCEICLIRNKNYKRTANSNNIENWPKKIVVMDRRAPRSKRIIDEIGNCHPEQQAYVFHEDKVMKWLMGGAVPRREVKTVLEVSGLFYKSELRLQVERGEISTEIAEAKYDQLPLHANYVKDSKGESAIVKIDFDQYEKIRTVLIYYNNQEKDDYLTRHESMIFTYYRKDVKKASTNRTYTYSAESELSSIFNYANRMWNDAQSKITSQQGESKMLDYESQYLSFVFKVLDDDVIVKAFSRREKLNAKREEYVLNKQLLTSQTNIDPQEGQLLDLTLKFQNDLPIDFTAKILSNEKDILQLESLTKANSKLSHLLSYTR